MTVTEKMIEAAHSVINKSWWTQAWDVDVPKGVARNAIEAALEAAISHQPSIDAEKVEPIRRDLAVIIATLPHMGGNERSTHSLLERANSAVATLNVLTKGTSE